MTDVTFIRADGSKMRSWEVRAGAVILETTYRHAAESLECTLADYEWGREVRALLHDLATEPFLATPNTTERAQELLRRMP